MVQKLKEYVLKNTRMLSSDKNAPFWYHRSIPPKFECKYKGNKDIAQILKFQQNRTRENEVIAENSRLPFRAPMCPPISTTVVPQS